VAGPVDVAESAPAALGVLDRRLVGSGDVTPRGQPASAIVAPVELRLLGPVETVIDGEPVLLRRRQERLLLSILTLARGRFVPLEHLADLLWEQQPSRSREAIQAMVSHLRAALGPAERHGVRLSARGGSYALKIDDNFVDVHRFRSLAERARTTASPRVRADLLGTALALWRGPALADAADDVQRVRLCGELDESHLTVREDWLQARLELSEHHELVAELTGLVGEHPLRERLAGQLMVALYRCERRADALGVYRDTRRRLVAQLGLEPGPDLGAIERAILTDDLGLLRAEPADGPRVPAQLPADVAAFAGRDGYLKELDALLPEPDRPHPAVVITALAGTAGVGKTSLAVRWAHRVRHRFPDGQFYINLRGFHPTGRALTASEALHGFLTALGLPPAHIPPTLDAQSALYRTLLADRRMLVLLDNARDADQVRPLLPGAPGCLVLITSRHGLTSLIAAEAAHPVPLDLLTLDEARDLLTRRLGADRTAAEPNAVDMIIERCARLPLALAIAAARAATRPKASLADLAADLSERRDRLDALSTGEDGTDVRAVFSWSYRTLGPAAARLFRLLGLHPGADISASAAASLAGLRPPQVAPLLDELTGAHLLSEPLVDRYTFHDLLQAYAADLTSDEDPAPVRRDALTRLFDHYLHTAGAAVRVLFPAEQQQPAVPAPAATIDGPAAARAWLDTERANLIAVAGHTAAHGWPEHTTALATTLFRFLDSGYFNDALVLHTSARQAARECGDRSAEARALDHLGLAHRRSGRFHQAAEHHEEALTRYRQLGDRGGEARALSQLGIVSWRLGRYQQSQQQHQAALDLYRQIGDRLGEAHQLNYFGVGNRQNGRIPQSIDYHQQALALFRSLNHRYGEATALDGLGFTYQQMGNHQPAIDCHQQAMAIFRELGHRTGEASAMTNLGYVFLGLGDTDAAGEHYQRALVLGREIGERSTEIEATSGLGAALLAGGNPETARARYTTALTLADRIGDRYEQATAHRGLADTYHTTGDTDRARRHWQHAQSIYTELGLPDADQVADKIRNLDRTTQQ
jgi:DNA-binding SARP family transcriptional activator/tetratricopeptide (TPR) repeat protein